MPTVRECLKAVNDKYWHSPDYFGESGTYQPKGASDTPINVKIEESKTTRLDDREMTEIQIDQLLVATKKDADKGITNPKIGDSFLANTARDPSQRRYYFSGEIRDNLLETWIVVFERESDIAIGVGE